MTYIIWSSDFALYLEDYNLKTYISKLNPGKAAGPDSLTSRILKELHIEVAPLLADIFNISLREGKVPDD